jgi:hypothetical protein
MVQQIVCGSMLKYSRTKERLELWILVEEFKKDAVCYRFCETYIASTLPRKLLKGMEASK